MLNFIHLTSEPLSCNSFIKFLELFKSYKTTRTHNIYTCTCTQTLLLVATSGNVISITLVGCGGH